MNGEGAIRELVSVELDLVGSAEGIIAGLESTIEGIRNAKGKLILKLRLKEVS